MNRSTNKAKLRDVGSLMMVAGGVVGTFFATYQEISAPLIASVVVVLAGWVIFLISNRNN